MTRRARLVVISVMALSILSGSVFVALPIPESLFTNQPRTSVRFTDRDGGLLMERRAGTVQRRALLPTGPIPPQVQAAFIAAEDARFESHPGVDPFAIARAAWTSLLAHRVVSGASTITQQLARQLVPRPRSLLGKAREALWAVRLTLHEPRERILREYLDRVPLDGDVVGVEAAAETYFGRPAERLSIGQAALLAGMARAPARFDPWRHPDASCQRRDEVLSRMVGTGAIDRAAAEAARVTPLDLTRPAQASAAEHFVTALATQLPDAVRVETTLDPALQADVEIIMRSELRALAERGVTQAAVLVVDNPTGEVLAYAGSADFFDERHAGQNDGVRAHRQPGSALKPFVYGLALSKGLTAATVLPDLPQHYATPAGDYSPQNYDRRSHGPVRLRAALANSYNVPAVGLVQRLGVDSALAVLRDAGFESLAAPADDYGLGVVLGNGDVTLRELARAYRGIANGGVVGPLVEVRRAWDLQSHSLAMAREMEPRRFLPADTVALLTDLLSDETARAPAFGIDNALRLPFPTAVKTGTSRAWVDNWTVGFTHERTVGVWVGNFSGAPMERVSGITGAGPIFQRVMRRAMRDIAPAPLVDRARFAHARICPLSGQIAGTSCPGALDEVFLPGTAPEDACPMHRGIDGRFELTLGPEYETWAAREGLRAVVVQPPSTSRPRSATATVSVPTIDGPRLVAPAEGDEYALDPAIPERDQTIPVRVITSTSTGVLEISVDRASRTVLAPPYRTRLAARLGTHSLEVWQPGSSEPLAAAHFSVR
jgi:penicillin-binding protein 1C